MNLDLPKGFWYETLDSTMDEARRLIEAGRIEGTAFVVANHQSSGRGTHGRSWKSPESAGIYLSVVHVPLEDNLFLTTSLYTLAAGVASVEAIREVTGIQTELKPINDIFIQGKKLGGILVESDLKQNGISALITGIGINTHYSSRDLDRQEILPVSLEELMPDEEFKRLPIDTLTEMLVAKVCFWYSLLFNQQEGQVLRAWERYKMIP